MFLAGCETNQDITKIKNTETNVESDSNFISNEGDITSTDTSTNTQLIEKIEKETLTVGCDPTYPPFEFLQEGQIVGFDIDIINEIAIRLDKQIEISSVSWDPDFKELREGKIDLIISAVCLNVEKESIVDFSIPYFKMNYLLISPIGSEIKLKESLIGKKVGVLEFSDKCLDEDYLKKYEIVVYKDINQLLAGLRNSEVDAVLLAIPVAVKLLKENKDMYTVLEEVQSNKEFCIVCGEGSILKGYIDNAISGMFSDGKYKEIYDKWFNYKF